MARPTHPRARDITVNKIKRAEKGLLPGNVRVGVLRDGKGGCSCGNSDEKDPRNKGNDILMPTDMTLLNSMANEMVIIRTELSLSTVVYLHIQHLYK